MKARLVAFGEVQIEGESYARDVVIEGASAAAESPSKARREQSGHTPLSVAEATPWGRHQQRLGGSVSCPN